MRRSVLPRLLQFDLKARPFAEAWVAGVDEVGRGPLAGPVVAAAVVLRRVGDFNGLNDSKQVPEEKREKLFREIIKHSIVGIGIVDETTIDEINIYQASRLAMRQAVLSLTHTPDLLVIDGKARLDLPIPQQTVVGGDGKSASIAAASIVAKVYRDHFMAHMDTVYPAYHFARHKGYATELHRQKIKEVGPCPIHRKTFLHPESESDLCEAGLE